MRIFADFEWGKFEKRKKDVNKCNQVYSAESQTLCSHVIIFIPIVYADLGQKTKLDLDLGNIDVTKKVYRTVHGELYGSLAASFYGTKLI